MEQDERGPLVHIGFPKCASTFLQRSIFPECSHFYVGDRWESLALDRFVLTDAADFDAIKVAAQFDPPLSRSGRVPALSNENLVGGAAARYDWLIPTADRLVQTFPKARILIVVREQRSMVLSLYRQLVKRGESVRLRDAISPIGAVGYYPRLRIERLRYHLAVQVYLDRFGPERVRVLPYEALVLDDQAFVDDIVAFGTGQPFSAVPRSRERANVGYRALTLETRRRLNVASAENYTGPGGPHWSFVAAQRAARIADRWLPSSFDGQLEASYRSLIDGVVADMYVDSNRMLADLTGLDLGRMGYML